MKRRGLALVLGIVVVGCTRPVVAPPSSPKVPVAPISTAQVGDLVSASVREKNGNQFVTVHPDQCRAVAREVEPPLIVDAGPAATDGGHWVADDGRAVYVEELVGVYRSDFDATAALANAKRALESCRDVPFTVISMLGRTYSFTLQQVTTPSPDIVLWSYRSIDWACDNAFVAAYNAAVELTTCSPINGYDVLGLAADALKRIERLANTAA
jgi:hypothetical protein